MDPILGNLPATASCAKVNNIVQHIAGNGELIAPQEHASMEELVGLSPRSTISDDYLAGASPQMSEDEDAAENIESPPDNMPESSHPSIMV